ncbi:hypothetical protein FE249_06920 [Acidiphilium multivorum]|uniref:hypothetical protein n=1 Tax=Acidiphilium multivorum TaxID=62140 RepID=UPI001F4C5179|nr:hypothetical protein [Acidiphilium multivorum]UNC13966.1 hypothetical protein FE249_06920 [Acidiphilium multivorum]
MVELTRRLRHPPNFHTLHDATNAFWQHHNGIEGFKDWEIRFEASTRAFTSAFKNGHTVKVLSFVFDRFYVLRNQLVHGGSTWNSTVNRAQVRDGGPSGVNRLPVRRGGVHKSAATS